MHQTLESYALNLVRKESEASQRPAWHERAGTRWENGFASNNRGSKVFRC
jgi:hypothetical protein